MTTDAALPHAAGHERLAHFPIVFFATVMGLSGLALAVTKAEHVLGRAPILGPATAVLAAAVMVAVSLLYLAKALRHPGAVAAEWNHPVRLAFFPAASIGLILLGTAFQEIAPAAAFVLWAAGAAFQITAMLAVVAAWIGHRPFAPQHMTPAWFIPAVGNIIVPIAGVGFGQFEVSWFFFSVGLVFWIVLTTVVFNRMVFHDPIPARLLPTLMILVAPPSVGFLAWTRLVGGLDPFGRILFYAAVIFALVVVTQAGRLRKVAFAMSWWAYSFPLAAFAVATLRYGELAGSGAHRTAGLALAALAGVVIAGLALRTGRAIARGEICQPE